MRHHLQTILNELDEIILMPLKPYDFQNESALYRSRGVLGKNISAFNKCLLIKR